jgi:drug/metabolite transporter (DMT)-like permease
MSTATPGLAPAAAQGVLGIALLSYALFSVADVSVKGVGTGLSPFEVSFLLTVFSIVVLPFARTRGEPWSELFRLRRPRLTLFRSVIGTFAGVFSVVALTNVPFAEAYAVVFLAPVLALVLSVLFLAESVGWRRWSSVAAGIAGVLIVTRPGFREISIGHFAALAASLGVAGSIVCLRVLGRDERPSSIFATLTLVALLVNLPLMLAAGPVWPDPQQWMLLVLSGLTAGVGQVLLMTATRRAPANQIAPVQYSQLAWAVLYGAVFFAELPDWATIAGLACIAGSGLFLIQRRPKDVVVVPGTH